MNEFHFSLFEHERDNQPKPATMAWPQLCQWLSVPEIRHDKSGGALFSGAVFSGSRAKSNVQEVSLLVLDYDHAPDMRQALPAWNGFTYCAYTTFGHSTPEKGNAYRVVIPLAKPIPASLYPALWAWAYTQADGKIDVACKDSSRIMYTPAIPPERKDVFEFVQSDGYPLDWETLDLQPAEEPECNGFRHCPPPAMHEHTDKYTRNAVMGKFADAVERMRAAPDGQKHGILLEQGKLLGGLLHYGLFTAAAAADSLVNAIAGRVEDMKAARKTANHAIEHGQQSPITIDPPKPSRHHAPRGADAEEPAKPYSGKAKPSHAYAAETSLDNLKPGKEGEESYAKSQLLKHLTDRGILPAVIEKAILAQQLGYNLWHSPTKAPGAKGYGGPAAAFLVRRRNFGDIHSLYNLYTDAEANGGEESSIDGETAGQFWTADYTALRQAHTVVITASPLDALSVESLEQKGVVGLACLTLDNACAVNYGAFMRGKKAIIGFPKSDLTEDGHQPGIEAGWKLYRHLVGLEIAAFLPDMRRWGYTIKEKDDEDGETEIQEEEIYNVSLNDILRKRGAGSLKAALNNTDRGLIPGVRKAGKQDKARKGRVYLPPVDFADYWRFQTYEQHTIYIKTVREEEEAGADENGRMKYEYKEKDIENHLAGFRVADVSKTTIAGPISTVTGQYDDMSSDFYVAHVQTRSGGNILKKVVFEETLYDMDRWGKIGAVFNPQQFKRLLSLMENLPSINHNKTANFVGLAYLDGKLRVNQGSDCNFPEPADENCAYANLMFYSGRREDAKKLIHAYAKTFGRNAALHMLIWSIGTHLKLKKGFYPHLIIGGKKSLGKSYLMDCISQHTGMLRASGASLNDYRLSLYVSNTSFPIGIDEITNIKQEQRDAVSKAMQVLYNYETRKTKPKGRQILQIRYSPLMIGGESLSDLDSVLSKSVRTTLLAELRHDKLDPAALPRWPMKEWLNYLVSELCQDNDTFDREFASAAEFCKKNCSITDLMSERMLENEAIRLLAWRAAADFAGLNVDEFDYQTSLMTEMNSHMQKSDADRKPWVWIMEKIALELQRNTYPYAWDIQDIGELNGQPNSPSVKCLIIKPKEIMDWVNTSKDLDALKKKNPVNGVKEFKAILKDDGMILKDIHPYIAQRGGGGQVRHQNHIAIPVAELLRYGITLPRVDYASAEFEPLFEASGDD